jgi:phospholipid/cholesterol/gamma-HCH transport system substrate-binding protein
MERNANYALVGLATTLLFVGLVIFVIWLARLQSADDFNEYDVVFNEPVRGLSEGGFVFFNGIRVGEVTDIKLDQANPNRVVTRVRLDGETPVRVDSRAQLEPQGITGVNYIQITAGTPSRPLLEPTRRNPVPVIRSTPSAFAGLLEGGGTVLQRTVDALDRVNLLLSDQNLRTISATVGNVGTLTDEIAANRAIVGETRLAIADTRAAIRDAQTALQGVDKTTSEVISLVNDSQDLVNGDAKRALADVAQAAEEIRTAARDVRVSIQQVTEPSTEFARTGLPQINAAVVSLQEAADSVQRLTERINESPTGLLSRRPARELEVPQ